MCHHYFWVSSTLDKQCALHIPTHVQTPDSLADEVVEDACPQFWLMQGRRRVSERGEEIREEGKAIGWDCRRMNRTKTALSKENTAGTILARTYRSVPILRGRAVKVFLQTQNELPLTV